MILRGRAGVPRELTHHRGDMLGIADDVPGILLDVFGSILVQDQLGHPVDRLHRVVDLMGHAGDESPQARQLLGLHELVLQAFFFGDVPDHKPDFSACASVEGHGEKPIPVQALVHLELTFLLQATDFSGTGLGTKE